MTVGVDVLVLYRTALLGCSYVGDVANLRVLYNKVRALYLTSPHSTTGGEVQSWVDLYKEIQSSLAPFTVHVRDIGAYSLPRGHPYIEIPLKHALRMIESMMNNAEGVTRPGAEEA